MELLEIDSLWPRKKWQFHVVQPIILLSAITDIILIGEKKNVLCFVWILVSFANRYKHPDTFLCKASLEGVELLPLLIDAMRLYDTDSSN